MADVEFSLIRYRKGQRLCAEQGLAEGNKNEIAIRLVYEACTVIARDDDDSGLSVAIEVRLVRWLPVTSCQRHEDG